jgi:hypothetical protein
MELAFLDALDRVKENHQWVSIFTNGFLYHVFSMAWHGWGFAELLRWLLTDWIWNVRRRSTLAKSNLGLRHSHKDPLEWNLYEH